MTKRTPLDFDAIKMAAQGNWTDCIFPAFGIKLASKPNSHQPCPICGGKDRFRCDDKAGRGTWICNNCGAGDGFELVARYTQQSGYELMASIGGVLGVGENKLTQAQKDAWKKDRQAKEAKEQADKLARHEAVAQEANRWWDSGGAVNRSHKYLTRKCIAGTGLRQYKHILLAPMYFFDKNTGQTRLMNIQKIYPDGSKFFIKDGKTKDCFFVIGKIRPTILIAEGVATALAIYESLDDNATVVCAFNAGNLLGVGQAIRHMLPSADIVFCADDDALTASKTGSNTGIIKAQEAAQAVGGTVIYPK
ncbi:primase-helicase zinc-binding domain-containing protein [Moraxella sp.]|uniref:primase-helicase zinc-binding domain-containing protein n=1 Tax=Moraxella sp. TaxID=479 RepID=UPI0026DA8BE7|nr:primase-helicase zinc-binding domain-containing protein [Moraxella sp.]MDO4894998.1 primase-helicase zinc-binding domain-containing protein [Moraxella sp.]